MRRRRVRGGGGGAEAGNTPTDNNAVPRLFSPPPTAPSTFRPTAPATGGCPGSGTARATRRKSPARTALRTRHARLGTVWCRRQQRTPPLPSPAASPVIMGTPTTSPAHRMKFPSRLPLITAMRWMLPSGSCSNENSASHGMPGRRMPHSTTSCSAMEARKVASMAAEGDAPYCRIASRYRCRSRKVCTGAFHFLPEGEGGGLGCVAIHASIPTPPHPVCRCVAAHRDHSRKVVAFQKSL
jgi:hypothetical protein